MHLLAMAPKISVEISYKQISANKNENFGVKIS